MAYKNQNGRITIDENAAQQDIKNFNRSINKINDAINTLEEMKSIATEFQGKTANTIIISCDSLIRDLRQLLNSNENNVNFIKSIITKYKNIDQQIKKAIENNYAQ